jgi:hypothetical protein
MSEHKEAYRSISKHTGTYRSIAKHTCTESGRRGCDRAGRFLICTGGVLVRLSDGAPLFDEEGYTTPLNLCITSPTGYRKLGHDHKSSFPALHWCTTNRMDSRERSPLFGGPARKWQAVKRPVRHVSKEEFMWERARMVTGTSHTETCPADDSGQ